MWRCVLFVIVVKRRKKEREGKGREKGWDAVGAFIPT